MAAVNKVLLGIWQFYASNGAYEGVLIDVRDVAKDTGLDEATAKGIMEMLAGRGLLRSIGYYEYLLLRRPGRVLPAGVDGPYLEVLQAVLDKLNQDYKELGSRSRQYESSDLAQQLKCDGKLVYAALTELSRKRVLQEVEGGPVQFILTNQPPRSYRGL
ncbi:hypothetical protein J7J84_03380 [bacterium]|nr:hypothetical protein [bacterium]